MGEDVNKLDIRVFSDEIKYVSLGKLSEEIIDFITTKSQNLEIDY